MMKNSKVLQEEVLEKYSRECSEPCKCHGSTKTKTESCNKTVLSYKEAPHYLKFNPYITSGYRGALDHGNCLKSLFWWTNETINIWTHFLGWLVFLAIYYKHNEDDDSNSNKNSVLAQFVSNSFILLCFQACMLLSTLYHIFCCQSECSYKKWLSADLLGVSLSLLAIYISGIYYAFECRETHLKFYISSIIAIFLFALLMQVLPLFHKTDNEDGFQWRLVLFGGWAAYGVVPTFHWVLLEGFQSEVVQLLLPRIIIMYILSALAFGFYLTRFPERVFPGAVNYIGSSHQIWHILIFCALLHWYYTGLIYGEFSREKNICQRPI